MFLRPRGGRGSRAGGPRNGHRRRGEVVALQRGLQLSLAREEDEGFGERRAVVRAVRDPRARPGERARTWATQRPPSHESGRRRRRRWRRRSSRWTRGRRVGTRARPWLNRIRRGLRGSAWQGPERTNRCPRQSPNARAACRSPRGNLRRFRSVASSRRNTKAGRQSTARHLE